MGIDGKLDGEVVLDVVTVIVADTVAEKDGKLERVAEKDGAGDRVGTVDNVAVDVGKVDRVGAADLVAAVVD